VIRNGRIVQQVVFPIGREDLFAWFTEPERVGSWMGSAAQTDIRPGGVFSCLLPDGHVWDGVVVEVAAPNRLVLTLGWRDAAIGLASGMSLVEWDFALDARGTRLRMVHQHVPAGLLVLLNDVWGRLFARLRNVLAGRPAGPHPLDDLPRRLAELEAEGGPG
jgi:uncharacterized protein YndB with AHSA1/START domain